MMVLILALLLSGLAGSFVIHYLKNFLLREKTSFRPDWDGIAERVFITYFIAASLLPWALIPLTIILKICYRIFRLSTSPDINQGNAFQKVLLKSELSLDFLLSPLIAILVGIIFK